MGKSLNGKLIAILATDGFEQSELEKPKAALEESGAKTHIVSIKTGKIKGWEKGNWAKEIEVDKIVDQVKADDYHALLIPGGVMNPDKLRRNADAVKLVKTFMEAKKPVASICHGPWMLAEADVVKGRKLTSFSSIKTDMKNAGANWVDEEVVVDNGLVTSRKPEDIPAFNKKMIEEFAEGKH